MQFATKIVIFKNIFIYPIDVKWRKFYIPLKEQICIWSFHLYVFGP
jgi:hypothetical protein